MPKLISEWVSGEALEYQWAGNGFLDIGPQESIVIRYFFTIDVLLTEIVSLSFKGVERSELRTETPEGQQFKENQMSSNLSHPVSCGQGFYMADLETKSLLVFFGTYLPTINLIVFVQTPFKARAKDTAAKQNQQTEK